jgi:GNAT superfamily N-acetyltransferase
VRIRPARPDEHDALGALCVAAYRAEGLGSPHYDPVLRDVAGRAEAAEVLVAADDAALLGTVTLVLHGGPMREISESDEGEFRMLAVDPAAQGRGAGAALVEACAARARDRGLRALVASSQDRMLRAHALYRRLGFVREPARDWSPIPGVDLIVFTLAL